MLDLTKLDIEPYYQSADSKFTLLLGDSHNMLPTLPTEGFDLVVTDPPYFLSNGGTSVHAGKRVKVDKGAWDKSRGPQKDFDFHTSWIQKCRPLLTPNGALWVSGTFHSIHLCATALMLSGYKILNDVIIYKSNSPGNLGCRQLKHSHETLVWASKGKGCKHVFNYLETKRGDFPEDILKVPGSQMGDVWAGIRFSSEERARMKVLGKHPTQKPRKLYERIYTCCAVEGHRVLDPFCGHAPVGLEALKWGMSYVGIDSDPESLAGAVKWYEHEFAAAGQDAPAPACVA